MGLQDEKRNFRQDLYKDIVCDIILNDSGVAWEGGEGRYVDAISISEREQNQTDPILSISFALSEIYAGRCSVLQFYCTDKTGKEGEFTSLFCTISIQKKANFVTCYRFFWRCRCDGSLVRS